jgi:hypothetical protein
VFTEPLLRNGLYNPVVPPLLGADNIENTASSTVACFAVFTELLPDNELVKSVTIYRIKLQIKYKAVCSSMTIYFH